LTEVSVGFQSVESYIDVDGIKHFERATLNEVSVVIRGAVPGAQVIAVRSADRRRRMHLQYLAGRVPVSEWRRATQAARLVDDTAANEALERLGLT
jgi:hypothetical protein